MKSVAFEWSAFEPRASPRCLPAIAIVLGIRLSVGHPAAGMIAAGGAMSVGFGSFQRIGKFDTAPILLATIGMSVSILVGTLAGGSPLILAFVEALWVFLRAPHGAGRWRFMGGRTVGHRAPREALHRWLC